VLQAARHHLYWLSRRRNFIFRDENETAQVGSRRARREPRTRTALYEVGPSRTIGEEQTREETPDLTVLQRHFPWLNAVGLAEVSGPLKRDLETRAVERFFVNWTLYPENDGTSPGHMHNLHSLYSTVLPGSVLWLAVRAVAVADMRRPDGGEIPFHIKARQYYGAALVRLRDVLNEQKEVVDDHVLAALLLIDNFEVWLCAAAVLNLLEAPLKLCPL